MSAESNSNCPVCRTADIVCGKWTLLIIRDLAGGTSRFCELERSLEGISPRTLSLRLRALEEEGVVVRQTFPEVPPRVEYALTEKGEALAPLIEDMRRYGRRWLMDEPHGPGPARLDARSCKAPCRRRSARRGGEARSVRDPVLNQALKQLAAEAATRFATLVASGDQIPFDVDEQAGPDSPFHSYRPLTSEFVRQREDELRSLPVVRGGPGRGRDRRRRRSLPGVPGRDGPDRLGRAGRKDAPDLLRRALGRVHRVLARPRPPRQRPLAARRRALHRR